MSNFYGRNGGWSMKYCMYVNVVYSKKRCVSQQKEKNKNVIFFNFFSSSYVENNMFFNIKWKLIFFRGKIGANASFSSSSSSILVANSNLLALKE